MSEHHGDPSQAEPDSPWARPDEQRDRWPAPDAERDQRPGPDGDPQVGAPSEDTVAPQPGPADPEGGAQQSRPQWGVPPAGEPQDGASREQPTYGDAQAQPQWGVPPAGEPQYACQRAQPQWGAPAGQPGHGAPGGFGQPPVSVAKLWPAPPRWALGAGVLGALIAIIGADMTWATGTVRFSGRTFHTTESGISSDLYGGWTLALAIVALILVVLIFRGNAKGPAIGGLVGLGLLMLLFSLLAFNKIANTQDQARKEIADFGGGLLGGTDISATTGSGAGLWLTLVASLILIAAGGAALVVGRRGMAGPRPAAPTVG